MQAAEFLLLADQLPEGMLLVAADGEVLAVNRTAAQQLQRTSEQLAGCNLGELTGLQADELLTRIRPCIRSRNPVRLSLNGSQSDTFISIPACEGFLVAPAKDGQLARFIVRIINGTSKGSRFLTLNREIEKHRRLLKKLQQSRDSLYLSEKNLDITLHSIGDAVMVTDNKGRITLLNPVAEQLTGWTNEDARGLSVKTVFPIIDATTREPIENPIEKVLATGETIYLSNHTTLIAKDGTEYQISDSAAPIREKNGTEILGMVLVFNDVTESYRLREENTRSRLILQAIMDNLPAVVCVKDTAGRYTYINKQFTELYDLAQDDVLGKTARDVFPIDIANQIQQKDTEVLLAGQEHISGEDLRHGDDQRHYMVVRFALLDSDNNPYAVCSVATDMTRRIQDEIKLKEQEKLYRGLIETTAAVAWEYDIKSQRFLYMGPRISELTGYPAEQWTDFNSWAERIHPDDREDTVSFCLKEVKKGLDHSIDYRVVAADGRVVWIRDEVTVITHQDKPILMRGYFFDITNDKQTEDLLRRAQKMDAIGQLAGGIAHDFNNILAIITGNLALLEHQITVDNKIQDRIDIIKHSSERAITLTKQLLGFSRREAVSVKATDVNKVITNMGSLITQSLTPQIDVAYHCKKNLWETEIDRGDFEDVLLNLVLNARDAMAGRGILTIETHNTTLDDNYCLLNPDVKAGDYVRLTVSDNGIGITKEQQAHIFEPFYTTKEQGKGTGLGLSMVFGFVKRSHGDIKVYSEPGTGTTFKLYLPRLKAKEHVEETMHAGREILLGGMETILIVDDEPMILELAEEFLLLLGYKVLTASNGKQALKKLAQHPNIDLLFTDVLMPGGVNGFELAEKAIESYPDIKVLLTSGYTDSAGTHNAQEHFNANLLGKPYTQAELAKKLRECLKGKQKGKQQ